MANFIELNPAALTVSVRYQARKTAGKQPLPELADSIAAQGLLQNLVVTKAKKRGAYEVVAGGRRLQAIKMLITDGRWAKDQKISCLLVDDNSALEASITENVQREAMHPADEFEAFAALIDQGKTIEDVAARFAVTPHVVKRRMRLAAVAPELIEAYRADETTLEVLMAFSVSDDQQRQRDVWAGLSEWERGHPHIVRNRLTADELTADDGAVRYVGLDEYRAAGGRCYQDLFAQDAGERGTYLQDRSIIERLALDKLNAAAEAVRGEGWAWVDVAVDLDHEVLSRCGRVWPQDRELTEDEQRRLDELTAQRASIGKRMDDLVESDDEDDTEWLELDQQHDQLWDAIQDIHDKAKQWPVEMMMIAGAIVTISHSGIEKIHRGLIRPEDRRAAQAAGVGDDTPALRTSLPAPTTRPAYSEKLMRRMTAHKIGAVGADLAGKPAIALAVLVAQLAQEKLEPGYAQGFGLGVSLRGQALEAHAPDYKDSKAAQVVAEMRQHWLDILPTDENGRVTPDVLAWAVAQDQQTLIDLLAYCIAGSVQGIQHHETDHATPLDVLAETAGTDIADWWEPTAESFLQHVSKGVIVQAVTEGAGEEAAAPLVKMKKAQAVEAAEQALHGRNWLPEVLRIRSS